MDKLSKIYNEISEVAELIHNKGWAEKNAGNFSYKVDELIESISAEEIALSTAFPLLSDSCFVITGKGKRMRDIAKLPAKNSVVIRINSTGTAYSIVSVARIEVTSELIAHLAIHNMIAERGSNEKAVMHSHVTELIALTHINSYCNQEAINNLLWRMHPETIMFIPDGIGFVPFEIPGTQGIAKATVDSLKNHSIALWEKHGAFSIAPTLNDCFDYLDIISKSVKIYFMASHAGEAPSGLTDSQLNEIKKIDF